MQCHGVFRRPWRIGNRVQITDGAATVCAWMEHDAIGEDVAFGLAEGEVLRLYERWDGTVHFSEE